MDRVVRILLLTVLSVLVGLHARAGAEAETAGPDAYILDLEVGAAYGESGEAFAFGGNPDCDSDRCGALFVSEWGGEWRRMAADGWDEGKPTSIAWSKGRALLASSENGIQVSRDGGKTFDLVEGPAGILDAVSRPAKVSVLSAGERSALYGFPGGDYTEIPGSSLRSAQLHFNPAYPDVAAGQAFALAAGAEPNTSFPIVQRCGASFACSGNNVIHPRKDVPRIFVSPSFAEDGTVFAALTQGGLFRSKDGGRTFEQIRMGLQGDDQVVGTVQGMAFSPDFDAEGRQGRVYAAVLAVFGEVGGDGRMAGGIYVSEEAGATGTWEQLGPGSALDGGATAVDVAPDGRVFGAYLRADSQDPRGILCYRNGTGWKPTCRASTTRGDDRGSPVQEGTQGGDEEPEGAPEQKSTDGTATARPELLGKSDVPDGERDGQSNGLEILALSVLGLGMIVGIIIVLRSRLLHSRPGDRDS